MEKNVKVMNASGLLRSSSKKEEDYPREICNNPGKKETHQNILNIEKGGAMEVLFRKTATI